MTPRTWKPGGDSEGILGDSEGCRIGAEPWQHVARIDKAGGMRYRWWNLQGSETGGAGP
jgi:hypothetical protein